MTELARGSVVEIFANRSAGTGWIYRVDANGKAWLLTNEHVVRGSRTVTVRLTGSGGSRTGTVIGQDEIRDLAVLTICCDRSWQALRTLTTNSVRIGSEVAALGFPSGRIGVDLAVTRGIVSSFGFHDESRSWLIQTDAAINPGNSGGPLINARGEVIGVVSSRRDPVNAENIGFAISMRTVEQELDYLEVGATVRVTPTRWPTRTPTRVATRQATVVPTVLPSTIGVSGVLVQDPDDGLIGCSSDGYAATVISDNAIDSAAFLRFEVPNVREWSIGFLYHENDDDSFSSTLIWSDGPNDVFARHWTRLNGVKVDDLPSERINRNVLRSGRGQFNELSFVTSARGSVLRLNDEEVISVPASQLTRRVGWNQLCVGFHSSEDEPYSIRYRDLRTRFTREGGSGSLSHSLPDDGKVECPDFTTESAYISRYATDSWFVLDFTVPNVERWSFGVIYHGIEGWNSRTYINRNGNSHSARHSTYENREFKDGPLVYLSSGLLTAGATVRLEFETTSLGSKMYLDGSKILDIPGPDLTRRPGSVRLCAGLISGETDPYTIHFSNLWAWAE